MQTRNISVRKVWITYWSIAQWRDTNHVSPHKYKQVFPLPLLKICNIINDISVLHLDGERIDRHNPQNIIEIQLMRRSARDV